ncbi:uncharacterized protein LOC113310316 [Papaver somniferum]|uniref:uncharacterized protein LOC113310316 n=1 Tax=Papaver somniferum TaxID=3469 RepID=UPI000E700403|nr:uncharacterized protein LOC113310316 [Papaver somniferum]
MEKYSSGFVLFCSFELLLGLIAFSACVAAEFKRTKLKDVKLDEKLCYLPGSPAFGLGITALVCLSIVQILGTAYVIGNKLNSREKKIHDARETRKQTISIILLVLSWISYAFAIVLLGGASSMNKKQAYGRGWLDGDCYIVKSGVFVGTSVLVLVTFQLILGSIILMTRRINFG